MSSSFRGVVPKALLERPHLARVGVVAAEFVNHAVSLLKVQADSSAVRADLRLPALLES